MSGERARTPGRTVAGVGVYLVCLALAGLAGGCAHRRGAASSSGEITGINVVGEGKAEARPDLAIFQVGVEARRPTVEEARQTSAGAQQAVLAALRSAGIESRDIQTTQLSIAPDYEHSDKGRRLLGYVANNQVQVRMRALDRLGPTIDAAVVAGGNVARLDNLRFELSDPQAALSRARAEAIAHARAEAEQLAELLQVRVGRVMAVEEVGTQRPSPVSMRMEMVQANATPVEPGSTELRVEVRVRWAIEPR